MSNEEIIPTSEETETIILNIEGILNNLKPIIDKNVFYALNNTFNDIKNDQDTISADTIERLESFLPGMYEQLISMSGSSTRRKLKAFEINTLESYERYYSFKQKVEEFKSNLELINPNFDNQKAKLVYESIELLKLFNELCFSLAPNLFNEAIQLIYESLILTDDDRLIKKIGENSLIKESIGRKIQPFVSSSTKSIDYDYLDHDSIHQVQENDSYFSNILKNKKKEYAAIQKFQNTVHNILNENIRNLDIKINENNMQIKDYKISKRNVILKKVLVGSILPFFLLSGYIIGKDVSKNNPLYETETQIVDLTNDIPVVVDKYVEFDQTNTEYVSTVTIASPWKQTISGGDVYTRSVNVYSFKEPEGADDNYRLRKEDLTDENLTLKYHYNETTTDSNHSDKEEILVTETWQNKNNTQENQGPISAGLGWGFFLGILTLAGGYFLNKKSSYDIITSSTPISEYNKMIRELNDDNNSLIREKEVFINSSNVEDEEIDYEALLAKRTSDEQEVGFQKTK